MTSSFKIREITSLDLPELQPYRTLRRPAEHMQHGIFVAEGEKVLRRLLRSDLTIVSMLLTRQWLDQISSELNVSKQRNTIAYLADKRLLETIVGYNLHQGIMAVAKVPMERSLEEILSEIPKPHLLVALDGLEHAENVGIVVRNCAAFSVHCIIVGETSSSPYLRRAVRNSMGAVFHLPVVHTKNLAEALAFLHRQYATRIIAAHPHEKSSIRTVDLTGNLCIVFGNEGTGISKTILEKCTDRIAIPMMNETDSLNVGSASAVFLYEAGGQRFPQE